jgi:hypothetical protein
MSRDDQGKRSKTNGLLYTQFILTSINIDIPEVSFFNP